MREFEPNLAAPERAFREERDRFVALAFSWADIVLELDGAGVIAFAAGALEPLVGAGAVDVVGRSIYDLLPPADRAGFRVVLSGAGRSERFGGDALCLYGPQGASRPLTYSGYRLADLNGHYFVSLRTPSAPRRPAGFGRRSRDEASGLLDGGSFVETVTRRLAESGGEDRSCSLIVLPNYDELKRRLAADAETELLAAVGERLRAHSVGGDGAARLGDDRYALLHDNALDLNAVAGDIANLTRRADPEAVGVRAESATVDLAEAGRLGGEGLARSLLRMVSRFREARGALDLREISTSISTLAGEAVEALDDFSTMIADGDFAVVAAPVVYLRTGEIVHYDVMALLPERMRGRDPLGQLALAEASGAVVRFDLAMVGKTVEWMARAGAARPIACAVNVSAQAMGSLSFLASVDVLLKDNPWLRNRLILEVAATPHAADAARLNDAMQRLREKSILVGLADSGAGLAGLSGLASFDVDLVKVAGDAVRDARRRPKGLALTRALAGLCRELSVDPVAEAIDDDGALRFARECGIDYGTGALFGPPSACVEGFPKAVAAAMLAGQDRR